MFHLNTFQLNQNKSNQASLEVYHISISLTKFVGTSNPNRILYNATFLTEPYAFLKSLNS
jgi:hypothetical protein